MTEYLQQKSLEADPSSARLYKKFMNCPYWKRLVWKSTLYNSKPKVETTITGNRFINLAVEELPFAIEQ